MSDLTRDFFGVLMAIVGVAILYTLVNPANQTPAVVGSVFQGFGGALSAAMGQAPGASAGYGG